MLLFKALRTQSRAVLQRAPAISMPKNITFNTSFQNTNPSSLLKSHSTRLTTALSASDSVTLRWDDGTERLALWGWLHRFCSCPSCKQPFSGQLMRLPSESPANPLVKHAEVIGDALKVTWAEGHHVSEFDSAWLREFLKPPEAHRLEVLRDPVSIPRISAAEIGTELGAFQLVESLARFGLAVVTNAGTKPDTVSKVAERIGPVQRTIYGNQFDVVSSAKPINIAYSNVRLSLHQDLIYYESAPALQLLHCLRFDAGVTGGESSFMDAVAAAELLRETNPLAFDTLTKVPASFHKVHYDRDDPVHLVYHRPHISTDHNGDITQVSWAPPFERPPRLSPSLMADYLHAYSAFASIIDDPHSPLRVQFRLSPGEVAVFNNRRMVHGRESFSGSGGRRHLQGCYVGAEDVTCRLNVLASSFAPPGWTPPRLFFGSWSG